MRARGLDSERRGSWLPIERASGSQTAVLSDGTRVAVDISHAVDDGYHTYDAVIGGAVVQHGINPGQGGSGTLKASGAWGT